MKIIQVRTYNNTVWCIVTGSRSRK